MYSVFKERLPDAVRAPEGRRICDLRTDGTVISLARKRLAGRRMALIAKPAAPFQLARFIEMT
jgi:hypothetical protein